MKISAAAAAARTRTLRRQQWQ